FAWDLKMIHDHDLLDLGLREDGPNFAKLVFRRDKDHAGTGVAQGVSGLFGSERRVNGHGDRAQQQNGEIGSGPLRAILAKNRDAIALLDAPSLQGANGGGDVALGGSEENVVQCGETHGRSEVSYETNLLVRGLIRQCETI